VSTAAGTDHHPLIVGDFDPPPPVGFDPVFLDLEQAGKVGPDVQVEDAAEGLATGVAEHDRLPQAGIDRPAAEDQQRPARVLVGMHPADHRGGVQALWDRGQGFRRAAVQAEFEL
jgi:hypothetical protein